MFRRLLVAAAMIAASGQVQAQTTQGVAHVRGDWRVHVTRNVWTDERVAYAFATGTQSAGAQGETASLSIRCHDRTQRLVLKWPSRIYGGSSGFAVRIRAGSMPPQSTLWVPVRAITSPSIVLSDDEITPKDGRELVNAIRAHGSLAVTPGESDGPAVIFSLRGFDQMWGDMVLICAGGWPSN